MGQRIFCTLTPALSHEIVGEGVQKLINVARSQLHVYESREFWERKFRKLDSRATNSGIREP